MLRRATAPSSDDVRALRCYTLFSFLIWCPGWSVCFRSVDIGQKLQIRSPLLKKEVGFMAWFWTLEVCFWSFCFQQKLTINPQHVFRDLQLYMRDINIYWLLALYKKNKKQKKTSDYQRVQNHKVHLHLNPVEIIFNEHNAAILRLLV